MGNILAPDTSIRVQFKKKFLDCFFWNIRFSIDLATRRLVIAGINTNQGKMQVFAAHIRIVRMNQNYIQLKQYRK